LDRAHAAPPGGTACATDRFPYPGRVGGASRFADSLPHARVASVVIATGGRGGVRWMPLAVGPILYCLLWLPVAVAYRELHAAGRASDGAGMGAAE